MNETMQRIVVVALMLGALTLTACGSGGGGGSPSVPLTLGGVAALYPTNGANWNDYAQIGDSGTAEDTACSPTKSGCVHAGELRVVTATGKTSCAGLTAADSQGAFDWVCDASTGTAKFSSIGLADGKNLSDLLDFATPGWKQNKVTVYDNGAAWGVTPSDAWWTNPVVVDNDGGSLSSAGTIYVVTNDALMSGYRIDAGSVALVGQPGVIINGPGLGAGSSVISADGSVTAKDFLWIEGAVDAASDNVGIYLQTVRFSKLQNVKVNNIGTAIPAVFGVGVALDLSSKNTLIRVTAANAAYGVYLYSSSNNRLSKITASNDNVGFNIQDSWSNTLTEITASGNGSGVYLSGAWNNTLFGITASNNGSGVYLSACGYNTLTDVTASNNSTEGVHIGSSSFNTITGITSSNNVYGLRLDAVSDSNTLAEVTTTNNSQYGIYLAASANNYFTGRIKVGNNLSGNCYVSAFNGYATTATNPGLDDDATPGDVSTDVVHSGLCIQQGSSDFGTAVTGITLVNAFVGKVLSDDTVNTNDGNGGAAAYPADPAAFDWSNFENPFRGWGIDGTAFPNADHQGQWTTGAGRIWDWSLLTTDTVIRNVLAMPTGNDTLIHTWLDLSTTTFLRRAVEIQDDGIGNDNGLCESGETCLYTPNIGSYQGHGTLVSAGTFTNGTLTGITLMKYETNGY